MKSHLAKPEPFRSGIYQSWSFRYPSLLLLVSTARCSPLSIACMQHTCLNPASLKFLPQQLRVLKLTSSPLPQIAVLRINSLNSPTKSCLTPPS